jgi:rRNA-processing protein FCF1
MASATFDDLLQRYHARGVLVDTNILLLFFVGHYDISKIGTFKRTLRYSAVDFKLLAALVSRFKRMVTTPNILTEVSNLSAQLGEPDRSRYFASFATRIGILFEEYVPSVQICAGEQFAKLGLTDTGIACLVKDKYLVLTDDLRLYQFLERMGIDTINFAHLRVFDMPWPPILWPLAHCALDLLQCAASFGCVYKESL